MDPDDPDDDKTDRNAGNEMPKMKCRKRTGSMKQFVCVFLTAFLGVSTRTIAVLILYTIKSVSIFSILLLHVSFGIDRENSCNNQSSKVGNHFLYSYDVTKLFSSIIVRRNWTLVTLRV